MGVQLAFSAQPLPAKTWSRGPPKVSRAEFFFTGAEIQPGRPVVFGRAPNPRPEGAAEHTYFFGLPGNPISTMVCFELFARVAVEALSGAAPQTLRYTTALLGKEVRVKT